MGKGKKKGGGKATTTSTLEAAVSGLSVSDAGASTSQPPEEEFEGLTGVGKKQQKKKPAEAEPLKAKSAEVKPEETAEPVKAKSAEVKPEETPSAPSAPVTEPTKPEPKEEQDVGLGLTGGSKKSRPRKKKPSQAALEAQAKEASQAQPVAQTQQAVSGPPGYPIPGPPQTVGAPHGYPTGPPQSAGGPHGYPTGPPQTAGGPHGFSTGPPQTAGWQPGYQTGPPQDAGGPRGYPTGPPQTAGWQPGYPTGPPQAAGGPRGYPPGPPQTTGGPRGYPPGPPQTAGGPRGYPSGPPQTAGGPRGYPPGPPQTAGGPPGYPTPGPPQGQARPWSGAGGPQRAPQRSAPLTGVSGWGRPEPTPMQGSSGPQSASQSRESTPSVASGSSGQASQSSARADPARDSRAGSVQSQASASGDKKHEALPRSRKEKACMYEIPAKILGRGVPCTRTQVITNYLPMTIKPIKVHRYDFTFEPDRPKKMIPEVFKIIKARLFPNEFIAFDMYKNGYCLNLLDKKHVEDPKGKDNRKEHKVDFSDPNGRIIVFTVSFKHTGTVDFSKLLRHMASQGSSLALPMEEVQCMDVVLRQGTLQDYVKCGRNFFKRPERPIDLGGALEMWTGLFQSAIFTSRPFINVDVAHKGFPKHQSMLDAWKTFELDLNRPIENQMGRGSEGFKEFVRNLRVSCKIMGGKSDGQTREFIINSIKEKPTHLMFTKEDGRSISVFDYYKNEKGYKIRYPALPCLWVGARNKNIYYPLELCTVVYGQALRKQLNEFQLATMVRQAATPPDDRKRKIEEVARSMNYSANPYFKKFGLEISDQFLQVEAKVLTAPTLNCGENQTTFPRRGAWNSNKLLKPEALASWGFIGIELQPRQCNFDMIKSLLAQTGAQLGMQVSEPKVVAFNVFITDLRAKLYKAMEDQIRLVFIIVPARGRDFYHKVKQFAECDVGILTQCIKEQTATRRMNAQTIKNILLKVNSKLMGINQCLDSRSLPSCIASGGVMIVGADVTHPSPDQQNIPSIAAVTASMDPKCFIYNIEMSIQSPKEEVIRQFEDMMYDHLKVFLQHNNNRPPRKIYVFRDGVSEGQFAEVMNRELTGLLNAYAKFSREKPEVLFLLVQKRHHTRLFGTDRNKQIVNVDPGTVVDTQIVHPKELDFYLVSHAAIKGTARPTRYHSVCNDGGIPQEEVEQLTYYLCHLYSRCMRSVSYPTPTYYAHLACLRARSLTHGTVFDNPGLENNPKRLRVLDKMLRSSRMFFV